MEFDWKSLVDACWFETMRSSGPGGQHVNKTESKVVLNFDIRNSNLLNEEIKKNLIDNFSSRINEAGILFIKNQSSRSQSANKESAIELFKTILLKAATKPKKRIKTKISKAAKEKRLTDKKITGEKKRNRNLPL